MFWREHEILKCEKRLNNLQKELTSDGELSAGEILKVRFAKVDLILVRRGFRPKARANFQDSETELLLAAVPKKCLYYPPRLFEIKELDRISQKSPIHTILSTHKVLFDGHPEKVFNFSDEYRNNISKTYGWSKPVDGNREKLMASFKRYGYLDYTRVMLFCDVRIKVDNIEYSVILYRLESGEDNRSAKYKLARNMLKKKGDKWYQTADLEFSNFWQAWFIPSIGSSDRSWAGYLKVLDARRKEIHNFDRIFYPMLASRWNDWAMEIDTNFPDITSDEEGQSAFDKTPDVKEIP